MIPASPLPATTASPGRRFRVAPLVLALAFALTAGTSPREARADKAAAEALFQEGRRLMDAKSYAAACPKLAESHRLDPGIGVLLYLGDCYAANGQTASAWAAFREAEPAARAAGQEDRARIAREKIAALEPKLSKIVLVPPSGIDPTSYEVRLDRDVFGSATLGVAVPIDPGAHEVTVSAQGKLPWKSKIEILATAPVTRVELPALAAATDAAPPAGGGTTPPSEEEDAWSGQKTAALVVGGVGVGALTVGAIFGAMTFSSWSDAEAACTTTEPKRCSPEGVDAADSASTQGTVSTIGFVVGGAAIAGAAALWLTAPSSSVDRSTESARAVRVIPEIGLGSAGIAVDGAF